MTRKCLKCSGTLTINEKLGYMECDSGLHIEPINLTTPQWWNQCPKCGTMGLNYADQEARLQAFEGKNKPVFTNTDKGLSITFNEQAAKPITCRACSHTFTKV